MLLDALNGDLRFDSEAERVPSPHRSRRLRAEWLLENRASLPHEPRLKSACSCGNLSAEKLYAQRGLTASPIG